MCAEDFDKLIDSDDHRNLSIAWRNLSYSVDEYINWKWHKKIILRSLTGSFAEGLNGVLGQSGSGKTTLLSCLSGNIKISNNQVYVSSRLKTATSIFIPQKINQVIIGYLTVEQIFEYAFAFKNGYSSRAAMEGQIKETMAALMLPEELLTRPFARCSGGEQRRIAVGQELMALTAPNFIFCDEPTTGLDSATAFELVNCLQKLAREKNITIISSIHAPNSETLSLFNQIYVLANGVAVFSGPPSTIRLYLEQQLQITLPTEQPPVEALIQITSSHTDTSETITFATFTQTSEFHKLSENALSALVPLLKTNNFQSFSFYSLYSLVSRQFISTFISSYRLFFAQILIHILNVIFLSSLFNNDMVLPTGCYPLLNDSNISCQTVFEQNAKLSENINFLVFCGAIEGFVITCSSSLLFVHMVNVVQHELRNKWYSLSCFYHSVNICSILELTVYVLCIATTAYFATDQLAIDKGSLNWNRLAQFTLSIWLLGLYTQSLGQLIGVIVMHSSVFAVVIAIMVYMTCDIMNDFLFKTDEFKNNFMITASNVVALKYVTKYMIYIFYGIDRCKTTEFSAVLLKHFVKENEVITYIRRLVENVIVMRVATLVALYFKFYSFNFITKLFSPTKKLADYFDEMQQIDFNTIKIVEMNEYKRDLTETTCENQNEIVIGWKNLSVNITENMIFWKNEKLILQNLNGELAFGIHAVMGPSGSGKTTFLKVLNGQLGRHTSLESRFYISKDISSCFISADVSSHLMPGLTTRKMILFSSRLKNIGENVNHKQVTEKWLQELNLMNTADTKVEHLSSGEQKRLAVALELTSIKVPNLLLIDELTSELDSDSSEIAIKSLHNLTKSHKISIICSVHQPSHKVLQMFDSLYVLAREGVCIFSGKPSEVQSFISETIDQRKQYFPIEELIKLSCEDQKNENVKRLVEKTFTQSNESINSKNVQLVTRIHLINKKRFSLESSYILILRYISLFCTHHWKEYLLFYIIIIAYASSLHLFWNSEIALTSGCLNINSEYLNHSCKQSDEFLKQDKDIDNSLKFIFFMNNIFLLLILLHSSLTLFKEMKYFLVEHRNGWYSNSSFYLMKSVVEMIPLLPMICLYIYICDIYSTVVAGLYWHFLLIIIISIYASCSMSHLIALCTPDEQIAYLTLVFMIVYDCFLLLSNFFVNVHRLNIFYQIVSYFSISRWAFEAVLLLIYGFGRCKENVEVHPVLKWLQIEDNDYFNSILLLLLNCAVFRVISFCLLLLRTNSLNFFKTKFIK